MPKKKSMTIDDLAHLVKQEFKESDRRTDKKLDSKIGELIVRTDKKMDSKIDESAMMVNNGFNETQKIINDNQKENIRRFNLLESGQEDIKLRLDNVAYRFEFIELQSRVKRLEKKVGIS